MGHTGKYTVRRKDKTYSIDKMDITDLIILKSNLLLDVLDIQNQIDTAIDLEKTGGIKYNRAWIGKAISAAKIKMNDVHKLESILDGVDMQQEIEEYKVEPSGIDMHKILTKAMKGLVPDDIIKVVLERAHGEINRRNGIIW